MTIPIELKRKCVELSKTMTAREIYNDVFRKEHQGMAIETFSRKLRLWKKSAFAPPDTLENGTYGGFTAQNATVQVNASGDIVQAWIKQTKDDSDMEELIEEIRKNTSVIPVTPCEDIGENMLEIGLYDMHFPLSDHKDTLQRTLSIVTRQKWEEINIIIGQDLFHNDDFRGRTSSGRPIEKVDMVKAWSMARGFWINVIRASIANANRVRLIYSKGNHDESMSWAFVQMLKEAFPVMDTDDSLKQRKLIYWKGCFVGITHGDFTKNSPKDLRGQFTVQFPAEFAASEMREIHCGHLHTEKEQGDSYGVMVRRLSRAGATDEWSDDEGYVGAHKRFMLFEWSPNWLKAIDYV